MRSIAGETVFDATDPTSEFCIEMNSNEWACFNKI